MKIQNRDIDSSNSPEVSIIIVNFKSWEHLEPCLLSITDFKSNTFILETIVVDNYSDDGEFNLFCDKFPDVKFIKNSGNNGFSNACNLGANRAKGNFFLFLNPDTVVTIRAISILLEIAIKNPNYGIISCEKINRNGKLETSTRLFPQVFTFFGYTRAIHKLINKNKLLKKFDTSLAIIFPDWVSGSVLFISKQWLTKVGGWNEDYWMYLEDVDLCKKISDKGGRIALTRNVKIVHNHGGASRINIKTKALTKVELIISKHVYIQNHFKGISLFSAQIFFFLLTISSKFLWAITGLFLFFIPKLRVNLLIFDYLLNYYFSVLKRTSWLSERSMNYKRQKHI